MAGATNDKYDRQLRLWGANGQRALAECSALLINSVGTGSAAGSETLKNLVLPGLGAFTIMDGFLVTQQDLGCNFFTSEESLGRPRAEVVTELLCEMNPDVKGSANVTQYSNDLLAKDPDYFAQFKLIVVSNMPEQQLLPLADMCWQQKIPLIVIKSYGLLGSIRLQIRDHNIIESKAETDPYDLRIANPFPELATYCDSIDLATMDSLLHSHTPYVVILYKAMQVWIGNNNGTSPNSFNEKEALKHQIKSLAKNYSNEMNFQEAVRESYRGYTVKALPDEVTDVLNKHKGVAPEGAFALLVHVLDDFLTATGGLPPLSGQVPDLTSTTDAYVALQTIYQNKAAEDLAMFKSLLQAKIASTASGSSIVIDSTYVELFCKNVFSLQSMSTRTVLQELTDCATGSEVINDTIACDLYDDPMQTPVFWYIALRAADRFYTKHGRCPGETSVDAQQSEALEGVELLSDERTMFAEMQTLCEEYALSNDEIATALAIPAEETEEMSEPPEEGEGEGCMAEDTVKYAELEAHAKEITRYGGGELHNVSALLGGVASQEAVKIITGQYVPLDHTYVYNGIACCGTTYAL